MTTPPLRDQAIQTEDVERSMVELLDFALSTNFQRILAEMRSVPEQERHGFVRDIILNPAELARRGIQTPRGLTIQRSLFADGRPALFCVTKRLSDSTRKVTVNFA